MQTCYGVDCHLVLMILANISSILIVIIAMSVDNYSQSPSESAVFGAGVVYNLSIPAEPSSQTYWDLFEYTDDLQQQAGDTNTAAFSTSILTKAGDDCLGLIAGGATTAGVSVLTIMWSVVFLITVRLLVAVPKYKHFRRNFFNLGIFCVFATIIFEILGLIVWASWAHEKLNEAEFHQVFRYGQAELGWSWYLFILALVFSLSSAYSFSVYFAKYGQQKQSQGMSSSSNFGLEPVEEPSAQDIHDPDDVEIHI